MRIVKNLNNHQHVYLKEYCDLSDRPVPTIFEFVPSKDQPLMFRENNLLILKQDHFDKIS